MAQNDDAVFSKRANSSSSSVVQYVCDCAKCKGSSWYAYRTVRRHRSIFGISTTKANLEASSNGKKGRRPSTGYDVAYSMYKIYFIHAYDYVCDWYLVCS